MIRLSERKEILVMLPISLFYNFFYIFASDSKKVILMKHQELSFFKLLKKYFNINADKEDELTTIENVESAISFRGAQLWILIFAIFIASLGLNVNSTAVIIGAMLISPLMGPIIGIG